MNLIGLLRLAFPFLFFSASVSAHAWIRQWKSSLDDKLHLAQKVPLSQTAYRDAPENIGWVGSKFLNTNHAIVCGASYTPKGTVAPPSGSFFSDSSQSAGQTLPVNAGGKITLVVASDPGKGYPHLEGHIQTYLGYCGPSLTACQSFDAASAYYFKIQEALDGVRQLRRQMAYSLGGDVWEVPIPRDVPQGSYIFRFEIVTYGESVQSEGFQDQYYPSCGQIYVQSDKHVGSFSGLPLIQLPSGYKDGNLKHATVPGPPVANLAARHDSQGDHLFSKSSKDASAPSSLLNTSSTPSDNKLSTRRVQSELSQVPSEPHVCLSKQVPRCAKSCFSRKLHEVKSLTSHCSVSNAKCLCASTTFAQAYDNCLKDHCLTPRERSISMHAFNNRCQLKSKSHPLFTV